MYRSPSRRASVLAAVAILIFIGTGFAITTTPTSLINGLQVSLSGMISSWTQSNSAPVENALVPTVTTDRGDYAPGEVVQISGSGFVANQPVTLLIVHIDAGLKANGPENLADHSGHTPWNVVVGSDGSFSSSWLVQEDSLNQTLLLTADQPDFNVHAETIFTDSAGDDFKQCANDNLGVGGAGRCDWIGSILQDNNSQYYEGMSTLQRLIYVDVAGTTGNDHFLDFSHDATKAGNHAYDFLTSWEQAIQAGADLSAPYQDLEPYTPVAGELASIDQTLTDARACGAAIPNNTSPICLALRGAGAFRFDVPVPDDAYISQHGSTQQRINGYETAYGQRYVRIYANQAISSASFEPIVHSVANGADTGDSQMTYKLRWTSPATQVMVEFATHISVGGSEPFGTATGYNWGVGFGASDISGGPYHVNLQSIDGITTGAQDNQLKGSDVLIPQGSITIIKNAVPDSAQDFGYTTTGGLTPNTFSLDDDADPTLSNTRLYDNLGNGTYTVTETLPVAGWALTNLVCVDGNGGTTVNLGTGTASINLSAGEDVVCTYTNTKNGRIEIEKQTLPDGSPATFAFTGDVASAGLSDGQFVGVDVAPGNYSSVESAKAGWALTSIVCNDADSTGNTGTRTASFVVSAGETVRCVFTNTQNGRIEIEKQTLPDGSTASFVFTGDVASAGLTDGQNTGVDVAPGNYSSVEATKTGWALTSIVCDDSNSTGNTGTRTASFVVAPGETVRCVFTNTQNGRIEIEKQTLPDASSATFAFTGDVASAGLSDGQSTGADVAPGNYSSVESAKAGWTLTSIVCNDSNSTGNTGTRTASFIVAPGETVRCVFTNTQDATITVTKDAVPNDAQDFAFTTTGTGPAGFTSGFSLDDDANATLPNTVTFTFPGGQHGTKTITEPAVAGWSLTALICTGGGVNSSTNTGTGIATIGLDPGEVVTCTYTNTKDATVTITKDAIPDDAQDFAFTSTGAGPAGWAGFSLDDDANATLPNSRTFTFPAAQQGAKTVFEAAASGWTLTALVCSEGTVSVPTRTASFTVDPGDAITCTYTNTKNGRIEIEKQTIPDGSGATFVFTGDVASAALGDNQSTGVDVAPGNYSSTEAAKAGWSLTNISCSDPTSNSSGNTATGVASFNVAPGETVRCVFTNTQDATLTVTKDSVPNDAQDFAFTTSGSGPAGFVSGFSLDDDSNATLPNSVSFTFPAAQQGTKTVTEPPVAGWSLTNLVCSNGGANTSTNTVTGVATIGLDPGESVTCTYTNTKDATVTIVKDAVPDSAQDFAFTSSGTGPAGWAAFALDDDADVTLPNSRTFTFPAAQQGAKSVTESLTAGWVLSALSCSEGSVNVATRTASFTVDPGDAINCTFTNVNPRVQIDLSPLTATNRVGEVHVITATVQQDDRIIAGAPGDASTGYGPAPNGTLVTFSLLNNVANAAFVGGVNTCTISNGLGTCSVSINTSTPGGVDIHATTTFSVLGVSLTATTGTGGDNSADAHKTYVDAQIDITPLTATNSIGDPHTFTATVLQDDGVAAPAGDNVDGWGPAPNGTLVTFSFVTNTIGATFVGGVNTCTTTAGSCSVQINSNSPGTVVVSATTTFSVGGLSLTRTTGTGGNNSVNAQKTYVASVLRIRKLLVPDTDTTSFTFAPTGGWNGGSNFDLSHNQTKSSGYIAPGTYGATETVVAGFVLTNRACVVTGSAVPKTFTETANGVSVDLGASEDVTCTFTNSKLPTLIIRKVIQGSSTPFTFTIGGVPTNPTTTDVELTPPDDGETQSTSQSIPLGNYTVTETNIPKGWLLTDASCVSDQAGGFITNNAGLPAVTFTGRYGDDVVCSFFDNEQGGATRTQGFWATHTVLTNAIWNGDPLPPNTSNITPVKVVGSADQYLCLQPLDVGFLPITATPSAGQNQVMGGFWASISQRTVNPRNRMPLDKARMQFLQQYLAAVLNVHAFGTPIPGTTLAGARAVYCGNSSKEIINQMGLLAAYNESGDTVEFTPGVNATAQLSKSQADIPFWNTTYR